MGAVGAGGDATTSAVSADPLSAAGDATGIVSTSSVSQSY